MLAPITPAEEARIAAALALPFDEAIATQVPWPGASRSELTAGAAAYVRPGQWFNDDLINFFFNTLRKYGLAALQRGDLRKQVWCHNSFFWNKLCKSPYVYEALRKVTAKAGKKEAVDIFLYETLLIPINRGNTHWCLAYVNMRERTVHYLDSLNGGGSDVVEALINWLTDEHRDKKGCALQGKPFTAGGAIPGLPQQTNGLDCGAFVCAFGEILARGLVPSAPLVRQAIMGFWRSKVLLTCLDVAVRE